MEKSFIGKVKDYTLGGLIGAGLYFGNGCYEDARLPVREPSISVSYGVSSGRVREILPEANIEWAAEETNVEQRMRSVGRRVLSDLEAKVDGQNMSALIAITDVIGGNYNNSNGPEFYGGSYNGRGTDELGYRIVVTPENVVSPRDVYDNIGTGNGNYIVIKFKPEAIEAYDALFVNASEQSPLPEEPEEPIENNGDDGNGDDGNGLPDGITRDNFNDIFGEDGLVPLNQPYTSVTEPAMGSMLSDAGVSEGTSNLVRYLIDNNYLRNGGGPYDSTNGPQGDFVFDQGTDNEYYLITRADEAGLELLVLEVPDTDAQRISNFIGAGRVTE
mgnify:CR=1 FL=1